MRKFLLSTILMSFSFFACNTKSTNKIEREGEPIIYGVEDSDAEMNQAIKKARQSLGIFDAALKSDNSVYQNFALKIRFETENGGEHIWIGNISFQNKKYIGIVDNVPDLIKEIKIGDTIEVDKSKISDWMFLENNVLRGGYSVRVLRNRMSKEERESFDKENGIIIED